MNAEQAAQALGRPFKTSGKGVVTHCPAHDDETPSLHITEGDNGKLLFHCKAGCNQDDVFAAVKHVLPANKQCQVVAEFHYKNAAGHVLYTKQRIEPGDNGKTKKFLFKHGSDYGRGCDPVFYNLPAIQEVETVYITEGEKQADKLASWGLVGTTLDSGSSANPTKTDLKPLTGKHVVILPDNDEPGQKYANNLKDALQSTAASIKIVTLPDLPNKGDIMDWAGDKAKLLALVGQTEEDALQDKPESLFVSATTLLSRNTTIDYLIDKIIEKDTIGEGFGGYGLGKTFVAIDAAFAVATGGCFAGKEAEQGLVLYLAGEGHHGFSRRIKASIIESGLSADDIALLNISKSAIPFDKQSQDKIIAEGSRLEKTFNQKIALIVVDTLARHLVGNENSTEDGNEFVQIISTIKQAFPGSVVLIIHHSGNAEDTKGRGRGASSIPAAMDFIMKIKKGEMSFTKMKDGPTPETMAFNLKQIQVGEDDNGEPITSCVVDWQGVVTAKRPGLNKANQLGFNSLLATCERLKQPYASVHDWRDEFYRRHTADNDNAKRQAFNRMREKLTDKKRVIHDEGIYRPVVQNATKRDIVTECTVTKRYTPLEGVRLSRIGPKEAVEEIVTNSKQKPPEFELDI